MIHRIFSDLTTFKQIDFSAGLNIILADKSEGASGRQTRNGAGKSSVVELIHFIMGANADVDSIFKSEALEPYVFGMSFDLQSIPYVVERSGYEPNKIIVSEGNPSTWPIISTTKLSGETTITNTNWKRVLGWLLFGLGEAEGDEQRNKYGPTYRSLFSYFVRRQSAGGFASPFKQSAQQQLWDQQVAITFLLGLDWTIPQEWQEIRDREKAIKELRKAAETGAFGTIVGTTAELRTRLAVAQERSRRLREQVVAFRVAREYRESEAEASHITMQLSSIRDDNAVDRQLLGQLERALESEDPPAFDDLKRLYQEAGVYLPNTITRRFDDVRRFHESIIQNRRSYLEGEIAAARQRLEERERRARLLVPQLDEIMRFLGSHGALDQYAELQNMASRQEAEIESLRQQFAAAEQLEGSKTQLDLERNRLLLRLLQDYREEEDVLRQAIVAFEETSQALYEDAGSLTVIESLNGPKFEVTIHGARSRGISNMQIFCFDMMLMRLCRERGIGPDFLVHDSHLFDGVDERQVARALQIGSDMADSLGFQYIVTMNSDVFPKDVPTGFDINSYLLPVRLTDATEDGGLFGIRFS